MAKFVHQWIGPLRIVEPAGFENFLVEREDQNEDVERFIAHVSFLISYHYPVDLLQRVAVDIEVQLEHEAQLDTGDDEPAADTITAPATAAVQAAAGGRGTKRPRQTVAREITWRDTGEQVVELRRRRRRNQAGHYVLEFELRPARCSGRGASEDERLWVSLSEYEQLFTSGRVVEDSKGEEGV